MLRILGIESRREGISRIQASSSSIPYLFILPGSEAITGVCVCVWDSTFCLGWGRIPETPRLPRPSPPKANGPRWEPRAPGGRCPRPCPELEERLLEDGVVAGGEE